MRRWLFAGVLWLGAVCVVGQPLSDPYEVGRLVSMKGLFVLERADRTVLAENLTLVSRITDLTFLPDGRFVLVSGGASPEVIVYNASGQQERVLGSRGRGPYQYESVMGVAVHKENVVVFDGGGLKFIEYRPTGEPVREIAGLNEGIDRFHFMPSGLILMYRKGGGQDGYLGLYDPVRKAVVRSFGKRTEIHRLLMMYAHSGGLAVRNDTIFYASPAEPVVYYVDLRTETEGAIPLQDAEFKVPELEDRTYSFNEIRTILFNVSRVRGVFALEDGLIVQTEHGRWEEGRRTVLHIVRGSRWTDAFSIEGTLRKRLGEAAWAAQGNSLYFISHQEDPTGSDVVRVLERWELRVR